MARKPITGKEYMKKEEKDKKKHYKHEKADGKMACKHCKAEGKTDNHHKHMKRKHMKGGLKMTPVSKGHKPKGAHGRAAVRALGRTKTTGNFAKIEKAKGKGAAIAAYQAKLRAHQGAKKKMSGKEMLGRAMSKLSTKHYKHK